MALADSAGKQSPRRFRDLIGAVAAGICSSQTFASLADMSLLIRATISIAAGLGLAAILFIGVLAIDRFSR
jgi:hypothetical protein